MMPNSIILGDKPLCRLCGHDQMKTLVIPEQRLGLGTPFRYGVCRQCRLVQLLDPPPDIETYYRNYSYHRAGVRGARSVLDRVHEKCIARLMRSMRRYAPPERDRALSILDVGCARGQFLAELKRQGFINLMGIEASEQAVRNRVDPALDIRCTSLEECDLSGPYDVITLNQVFEHFADPPAMLVRLHALLADHGRLVMSFPNYDSFARCIFGRYWAGYDAPRHFFTYRPHTVSLLCKKAGLKVTHVKYISRPSQFLGGLQYVCNALFGWRQTLENGFFRNSKALDVLFLLPAYAMNTLRIGDMIEVTVEKSGAES